MTPENRAVERWAASRGYPLSFQGAVRVVQEDAVFSVGHIPKNGIAITALLEQSRVKRKVIRQLRRQLRPFGKLKYNAKEHTLHFYYKVGKKEEFDNVTDNALMTFAHALEEREIQTMSTCYYCGRISPETDEEISPGVVAPVHTHCVQSTLPATPPAPVPSYPPATEPTESLLEPPLAEEKEPMPMPAPLEIAADTPVPSPAPVDPADFLWEEEIPPSAEEDDFARRWRESQANDKKSKRKVWGPSPSRGLLGALLGGLVTAVLVVLVLLFFNRGALIAFALLPLGMAVGYLLLGRTGGASMRLVTAVLSMALAMGMYIGYSYYGSYAYHYRSYKAAEKIVQGEDTMEQKKFVYPDIEEKVAQYPALMIYIGEHSADGTLTLKNFAQTMPPSDMYTLTFQKYVREQVPTVDWLQSNLNGLIPVLLFWLVGMWGVLYLGSQQKEERITIMPSQRDQREGTTGALSPEGIPYVRPAPTSTEEEPPVEKTPSATRPSVTDALGTSSEDTVYIPTYEELFADILSEKREESSSSSENA